MGANPESVVCPTALTISVDPKTGTIVSVSPQIEMMLGIEAGTLAGTHVSHLCNAHANTNPSEDVARFISQAGHDLVGPLKQVSTLAGLFIRKYRGQFDPDADELVKHMQTAAGRMDALVLGVRKYLDLTSAVCDLKPVDMDAVFTAAMLPFSSRIRESGAHVTSEKLPVVVGEANLLTLLFSELVDNSLKFQRNAAHPMIRVSARQAVDSFEFSIEDNGIGIAPQHREGLFRIFKRLNGHEYPGPGLGLAIVKRIVELHRGRVWIENNIPQGTKVSFTCPST